ncbi:MAG: amidohydrolase family protein [Rhodobacter sp.]|nr:amidohydrolase family protein [Rhodobacter sp.]MCA3459989.1 amidohydrolase family protein [Rhodobacter sp.]MCA3465548.1 amidohydrolase family protein [Rhodobacter sp.]MCA3467529.1 amidohydrolase family protein [Rhodobacter sp.]MCA3471643.1 amidohydrolase family protein [Rhodobacter sp.]
MIPAIDAHHHFWDPDAGDYPWMVGPVAPIRRVFTPEDLAPLLRPAGVMKTILVQTWSSFEESRAFLELASRTEFIAGVVAWVDLTSVDVQSHLDALLSAAGGKWLVGIRHQVHDEADPLWLCRPQVRRGLQAVADRGLTYDLLIRPREMAAALETAGALPDLRFVIDHIAKPEIAKSGFDVWAERMRPFGAQPNVWCKLSGMVTEADWNTWTEGDITPYIAEVLRIFEPRRCLMGTDWPVCLLAANYQKTVMLVRNAIAHLPEPDQRAILWDAAAEVYRLDKERL